MFKHQPEDCMCIGHALTLFFFFFFFFKFLLFFFWLVKIPLNYVAETSFLEGSQFFKPAELLDTPQRISI